MMNIKQELYDNLNGEIACLKAQVEKLTKEKESTESSKKYYSDKYTESQSVIEQMHLLLDAMEGAGSRLSEPDRYGGTSDRLPMTRLAQWLASRVKPA
jgi:hypothetical protein